MARVLVGLVILGATTRKAEERAVRLAGIEKILRLGRLVVCSFAFVERRGDAEISVPPLANAEERAVKLLFRRMRDVGNVGQ